MSIRDVTKKRGRPATGKGEPLTVRLQPKQATILDAWIAAQPEPRPSRPEAIRRLLDRALAEGTTRFPFDASPVPYTAITPGRFTLNDMGAAFNEMVRHISGGKPEVEEIVLRFVAHLLRERGYQNADADALKVEVSG